MSWTYADYESQATDSLRLDRLRLHVVEVSAKIAASVASDGMSRDATPLVEYLKLLQERRATLEQSPANRINAGISVARFVRPN